MDPRADRNAPRRPHGALKDTVLGLLLHAEAPMTAREVVARLTEDDGGTTSLTTVLTILDRLHRAGEVDRHPAEGGELTFTLSRHDPGAVADDMFDALLRSTDRTGALLSFAGSLDPVDLDALRAIVVTVDPDAAEPTRQ